MYLGQFLLDSARSSFVFFGEMRLQYLVHICQSVTLSYFFDFCSLPKYLLLNRYHQFFQHFNQYVLQSSSFSFQHNLQRLRVLFFFFSDANKVYIHPNEDAVKKRSFFAIKNSEFIFQSLYRTGTIPDYCHCSWITFPRFKIDHNNFLILRLYSLLSNSFVFLCFQHLPSVPWGVCSHLRLQVSRFSVLQKDYHH